MKHRNIKERRHLRAEFVYKFRVELLALNVARQNKYKVEGFFVKLNDSEKLIVERMRQEIGYSPRTNDYDIFYQSVQLLKRVLQNKPLNGR